MLQYALMSYVMSVWELWNYVIMTERARQWSNKRYLFMQAENMLFIVNSIEIMFNYE